MPLDQLVRYWKGKESENKTDSLEYIQTFQAHMEIVKESAKEQEVKQKAYLKQHCDKKAVDKSLKEGDFVLVFRPRKQNKLLNEWLGPYPITEMETPVTYRVDMEKKKKPKVYHVNCMRKWHNPTAAAFLSQDEGVKEAGEGRKEDTQAHMPLH